MEPEKNNTLMQEELFFKEQIPTQVPESIEQQLDQFIFSLEYRSEEGVLKKFASGYVLASLFVLCFFHQMGAGFFSFDLGSVLNFMGPVFKQLINGLCFGTLVVSLILVVIFDKKDLDLLLTMKNKAIYSLVFFSTIIFSMFGSEFTWSGAFLWTLGASFGAGLGLNFGIRYIEEVENHRS